MPRTPLEEAALQWVPGSGPVDIRQLTSGMVNDSWQVARGGRLYSLRMSQSNGEDLGLDRAWECRVLAQAAAAGLAPAIAHCEPARGLLIAEWVSGRAWTADEARALPNAQVMAGLLRRVHALPVPRPARIMVPRSWIEHYAAASRRRGVPAARRSSELRAAADMHLDRLAGLPQPGLVLCHGDLHRLNLKVADRLILLDWEYAHVADPLWDLAGWMSNNDGTDAVATVLLAAYLGRAAAPAEAERLSLLTWLYDYVCLVWSELYLYQQPRTQQQPETGGDAVLARAEVLAARMTNASGGRAGQVPAH
jgi:thiamine kinase